jgi:ribosomal protein S27AE
MPGKEDQEKKSVKEQNHVIEENYVSQKRNLCPTCGMGAVLRPYRDS